MRINNNLMAMNTNRQLGISNKAGAKSMEKLSSGFRINRASDDAAGLSISEKMRNQIKGLNRASANSQDGISLIQTAEGALDESHAILKRMRELTVQAGNAGTLEKDDLVAIKDEFTELAKELDGISDRTEFNGKKLLDGSYEGIIQIGANQGQVLELDISVGAEKGINKLTDMDIVKAGGDAVKKFVSQDITFSTTDKSIKSIVIGAGAANAAAAKASLDKGTGVLTINVQAGNLKKEDLEASLKAGNIEGVEVSSSKTAGLAKAETVTEEILPTDTVEVTVGDLKFSGKYSDLKSITVAAAAAIAPTATNGDLVITMPAADVAKADKTSIEKLLKDNNIEGITITEIKTGGKLAVSAKTSVEKVAEKGAGSLTSKNLGVSLAEAKLEEGGTNLDDVLKEGIFFEFEKLSQEQVTKATDTNLERLDAANKAVSKLRSKLGANQNRLEHTIKNLDNAAENIQASESRIRDVDMAKEMIENTKQNILQQASTAMLAQANQAPQSVLRLLG